MQVTIEGLDVLTISILVIFFGRFLCGYHERVDHKIPSGAADDAADSCLIEKYDGNEITDKQSPPGRD